MEKDQEEMEKANNKWMINNYKEGYDRGMSKIKENILVNIRIHLESMVTKQGQ